MYIVYICTSFPMADLGKNIHKHSIKSKKSLSLNLNTLTGAPQTNRLPPTCTGIFYRKKQTPHSVSFPNRNWC